MWWLLPPWAHKVFLFELPLKSTSSVFPSTRLPRWNFSPDHSAAQSVPSKPSATPQFSPLLASSSSHPVPSVWRSNLFRPPVIKTNKPSLSLYTNWDISALTYLLFGVIFVLLISSISRQITIVKVQVKSYCFCKFIKYRIKSSNLRLRSDSIPNHVTGVTCPCPQIFSSAQ